MSAEHRLCQVAILAGGMGTRLKARTGDIPKPLAPILSQPVLAHQIDLCRRGGFTRIALLVHYAHEAIRDYFGHGERFGVELHYHVERDARGTAGALRDALGGLDSRFIVLYADTFADVDLRALWDHHSASGAAATLLLHPNDHPHDSDLVELDAQSRVVAVHAYPHPEHSVHPNLVNAALYVMERAGLAELIAATGRSDLAKHTFTAMLAAGMTLQGYISPEYIKDMGTPERLDKVERDIIAGLPERLSARHLRSAIFLDRDGTLNVEVDHLTSPSQLRLIDGVGDAVRAINRAGWLAVGITNQPVVARGEVTFETLGRIHATLDQLLGTHGAYLDRLYVCPHHPDRGFAGEVAALKVRCECRKPETGLIDRAVRELGISRRASWLVGDSSSDIRAGLRAGLRTILVRTGYAGEDGKYDAEPDYILPDLASAVNWILQGHATLARQLLAVAERAARTRLVLIGGPARAGKTSAARVLAEQLNVSATASHVISLDGWLKPVSRRPEGAGVLERYDMEAFRRAMAPIFNSTARHRLQIPRYDRQGRCAVIGREYSIGPDDVLIVEGVPALMDAWLVNHSTLRLFVDLDDDQRRQRLQADYAWRAQPIESAQARLASRELDEVPQVRGSAVHATDRIQGSSL